jgi:hypothetical protein
MPQPAMAEPPTPTELPTPEPESTPGPFGLPPLPETPVPDDENKAMEEPGPPVLPPSSTNSPPSANGSTNASVSRFAAAKVAPVIQVAEESTPLELDSAATTGSKQPADWIAPSAVEREPVSIETPETVASNQESHPVDNASSSVSTSEYVEAESSLQVMTAAEPEAGVVELTGHSGESSPAKANSAPKFVKPGTGFSFIR